MDKTHGTLKLLQENMGNHLKRPEQDSITQKIIARINKRDFIKLKTFCTAEEIINEVKE